MLLFTPGPTPVPESIRQAMSLPTIHHRTPEFEAIFAQTREMLLRLFDMPEVLMLAATGSGAMEACISNLCSNKALTVNAGKFGERFGKIVQSQSKGLHEVVYDWNTPANADELVKIVKEDSEIDMVCIQLCESAGGLRHPVEKIAGKIKAIRSDIMIVADGITAVGVERIDTTCIDALIAGSQKAFMLPPGLAMAGLSESALKKVEKSGGSGFYFNFAHELKNQRKNTTAWTAATTLIIGLKAVLDVMFEKGLDQLYNETKARAEATREALNALGLKIYPKTPALAMSAVFHEEAEQIRKLLGSEYGINVAGGQDQLKGKLFRINHMGLIELYEAAWVINAVELAMSKLKWRTFDGLGNTIFLQTYYQMLQASQAK